MLAANLHMQGMTVGEMADTLNDTASLLHHMREDANCGDEKIDFQVVKDIDPQVAVDPQMVTKKVLDFLELSN